MNKKLKEHITLHLQDARRCCDSLPDERGQLEFNLYEIAGHLGITPKEVNTYTYTPSSPIV